MIYEVVFLPALDNHTPETVREVNFVPSDLPFVVSVEAEEKNGFHSLSEGLDSGLVLRWFRCFIDGRVAFGAGRPAALW